MKLSTLLSQPPLQPSRLEMTRDEFQKKRLLSLSQPELDTADTFDIPSPPPVAANRFEPGFSALNQPSGSPHSHAGALEPLQGFDRADVPDEAPKAPIATIPELQMGAAASSEESIFAREDAPQSALTPAATAQTENQTTPIGPAEPPQVDLDPPGHRGAVSESTTVPQIDVHQRSATAEASGDASVGGNTSHDQLETPDTGGSALASGVASTPDAAAVPEPLHQAADSRPEAGAASAPGEVSSPEAVPPAAVPHKKSPRVVNQDKVYGALYDSLFPQSFTSEVLSSLLSSPPQIFTQEQRSETIVRTVDEYRTETSTPTYPSAHSAVGRDDPADPYADRISVSLASRFEAEPSKGSDLHSRAPPSSLYSRFESAAGGEQPEAAGCLSQGPFLHSNLKEDTPSTALQTAAPPVSDGGTALGRDARVTKSVPALTIIRHVVRDSQVSSRAVSLSPAPENKTGRNREWKMQTPAPPADMDVFVSPTYLSVGSDDGSAMDIYYSAEEDNAESADDEMFAVDEGGAQADAGGGTTVASHEELVRRGGFSARDVSGGDDGMFSGMLVRRGGEKTEEGQARGYGSEAHLQDGEKFVKVIARVEDKGTETREEKLPAKPVLQGNDLMVCDPVPPSAGKRVQPEDTQQIWAGKLETEEPSKGEQRSFGQPLDYPARKNGPSDDARQEVIIIARSTTTEKQVSIAAEAERSSQVSRSADGRRATSAGADDDDDAAAPLTGSLTHRGSAAEHNRLPQRAEWVDTITRSAGRSRNPEPEVQLHLTETQRTAAAPLSESPEQPAPPDPSGG